MKSYKGIVTRYIKEEKRSVIPIFISIILTISVITSIVFITENMIINNREEKKLLYGDYDVRLQKINNERLNKLKSHENVKDYTLGKNIVNLNVEVNYETLNNSNDKISEEGSIKIYEGDKTESYLQWVAGYAVEKRFIDEYMTFNVIEGSLPQNINEIILDKDTLNLLPKGSGVGSIVEFNEMKSMKNNEFYENSKKKENIDEEIVNVDNETIVDEVEKVKYKIVGIIETDKNDTLFSGKIIRLLSQEEINDKFGEFEAFTYLKNPSKEAQIAKDLGLKYIKPTITIMWEPYVFEASDVEYPPYNKKEYSSLMKNGVSKTLLGITIIFCFIAVYNTFNSSIANRIKVYGILRAIGGTRRQISYLIYLESLILYIGAIPIGLILGYLITKIESYILTNSMGLLYRFNMNIRLEMILIILISVFGIIFLSVRSVLKKEGKLTPIEAITDARGLNRNMEIKAGKDKGKNFMESLSEEEEERYMKKIIAYEKTTLKYKITKKIFKFEGELAHKNIIRDFKTNKLTRWTLFITMATIIFFFLQIVNGTISAKTTIRSDKWDVEIGLNEKYYDENVIKEIENTTGVERVYKYSKEKAYIVVPGDAISKDLNYILFKRGQAPERISGFQGITANIISIDEKTINLYPEIDKTNLDNGGVVLVNKASNYWVMPLIPEGVVYVYAHMNPVLESNNLYKVKIAEDDTVIREEGLQTYYKENRPFKDINILGNIDDDIIYSTYNSIDMKELDSDIKLLTTEKGLNKIMGTPLNNRLLIKTKNNKDRIDTITKLQKISANNNYVIRDTIGEKIQIEINRNEDTGLNIIFAVTVIIMVILNLINTANSSIMSRRKELAAMRAIGMSSNQQMKMIIAETFYVSISVAVNVFLTVGLMSMVMLIPLLTAKKVSIITLIIGQVLIIIIVIIISNLTVLAPLKKANSFNIVDDLKEE